MLERYFGLRAHSTTVGREIIGGLTTFATMAYILVVHPGILGAAGVPREASVAVTAIIAAVGTIGMGLFARRPFAVAPYMGENAFIAFTVVLNLGHSYEKALGAVFLSGVLFVVFTAAGLREWLARSIPASLKHAFVVGIGLFLAFLGLMLAGIVEKSPAKDVPLQMGDLTNPASALALGGLSLMIVLHVLRVRAGILLAIVVTTTAGYAFGLRQLPEEIVSMPDIRPLFMTLDISGALTLSFLPVVLTVFILDFVDTMGTLIGVSARAGFLDEKGNLPDVGKPMLVDALGTVGGACLGTTTTGTFIESAAGIEAGGRTGLAAVVAGLCFIPALFFGELLGSVPAFAFGPALVIVGILMFEPIRRIDFADDTEVIPAFATIAMISFTYNIGHGITTGLIAYPLVKLVRGRVRDVRAGMWMLALLSGVYYWAYFWGLKGVEG